MSFGCWNMLLPFPAASMYDDVCTCRVLPV